ncbi:MAG: RsmE family RNA methyltransferase [Fusobacteria bacterium]|nr:RsmE family RNA methyltransferase [Fusobacteriota bacterium]
MRELYFTEGRIAENAIVVTNLKDIHHLKNVFRKQLGDKISIIDSVYRYTCFIESLQEYEVVLKIMDKTEIQGTGVIIDAALGVLKQDKMNIAIQKIAELGLRKLIPLQTRNCVVKLDEKKSKWDIIALETLKQCGGDRKLKIDEVTRIGQLDIESYDLAVVAWENEEKVTLKELIKHENPRSVLYIIGPEGGFTQDEITSLRDKNVKSITLGKNILRAETAAIVLGGILKYELE